MDLTRRNLLAAAGTLALAAPAAAAVPLSRFGLDAAQFGVHPGGTSDQSRALQQAINQAARQRVPLWLAPGTYRAGDLKLTSGAHLAGVRGQSRIILTRGPSLFSADNADTITLSGLKLNGGQQKLPDGRALVHIDGTKAVRITDCEINEPGGNGITLEACDGEVTHSTIIAAADTALYTNNCHGLLITANTIRISGNGGIRVWQSSKTHDGSTIADNTIEETHARDGGSGQNGNAINVYRAAGVMVRGNHIRSAAFSAIRGNAASNIQIIGNQCTAIDEVAIYCEYNFENAVIADNVIDTAGSGISVTNFKEGGRLAAVRGNVVRNLQVRRKDQASEDVGVGISVEADTSVTGNTIEHAQIAGISAGWGEYLRDVAITGNVVRACGIGVAVSVVKGAGTATISGNQLAGSKRGAIVGMEWHKRVTGDLALSGAERYPQLKISGNQVD